MANIALMAASVMEGSAVIISVHLLHAALMEHLAGIVKIVQTEETAVTPIMIVKATSTAEHAKAAAHENLNRF
jgi:hypothetical protein